jgi:hypothetical protein
VTWGLGARPLAVHESNVRFPGYKSVTQIWRPVEKVPQVARRKVEETGGMGLKSAGHKLVTELPALGDEPKSAIGIEPRITMTCRPSERCRT